MYTCIYIYVWQLRGGPVDLHHHVTPDPLINSRRTDDISVSVPLAELTVYAQFYLLLEARALESMRSQCDILFHKVHKQVLFRKSIGILRALSLDFNSA